MSWSRATGRAVDERRSSPRCPTRRPAGVGQVERRNGRLRFTYDADWQSWEGATPLSLSMPLATRQHPHKAVSAFLWGLLPDNDRVLTRWAREFGVSAGHPLGLLAHVGEDLPGAMRLVDPEAPGEDRAGDRIDWISEGDVAELLAQVRAIRLPGLVVTPAGDGVSAARNRRSRCSTTRDAGGVVPEGARSPTGFSSRR